MADNEHNPWQGALTPFGPLERPIQVGPLTIGEEPLALIAGPCAIESGSPLSLRGGASG